MKHGCAVYVKTHPHSRSEQTSQATKGSAFTSEMQRKRSETTSQARLRVFGEDVKKRLRLLSEVVLRTVKRSLAASLTIFCKKMVDLVSLIRKILSSSNGCELIENGYRFDNSRKYLCFHRF